MVQYFSLTAVTCTGFLTLDQGTVQPSACSTESELPFNTRCTFTCKNGFYLNGPFSKTCTANGVWSDARAVYCVGTEINLLFHVYYFFLCLMWCNVPSHHASHYSFHPHWLVSSLWAVRHFVFSLFRSDPSRIFIKGKTPFFTQYLLTILILWFGGFSTPEQLVLIYIKYQKELFV